MLDEDGKKKKKWKEWQSLIKRTHDIYKYIFFQFCSYFLHIHLEFKLSFGFPKELVTRFFFWLTNNKWFNNMLLFYWFYSFIFIFVNNSFKHVMDHKNNNSLKFSCFLYLCMIFLLKILEFISSSSSHLVHLIKFKFFIIFLKCTCFNLKISLTFHVLMFNLPFPMTSLRTFFLFLIFNLVFHLLKL